MAQVRRIAPSRAICSGRTLRMQDEQKHADFPAGGGKVSFFAVKKGAGIHDVLVPFPFVSRVASATCFPKDGGGLADPFHPPCGLTAPERNEEP